MVMHHYYTSVMSRDSTARLCICIEARPSKNFKLHEYHYWYILGLWESSVSGPPQPIHIKCNHPETSGNLGGWEPSCYYRPNSTLSFNYWLLAAIIHYLIISFIYTYIYLYPYMFILFCSNFLAFSSLIF